MGFFDMAEKFLNGAMNVTGDMARRSNDPQIALRYIEIFDQKMRRADLDTLEQMLSAREYAVSADSANDYQRQRALEQRIAQLRKERSQQIKRDREDYDLWLKKADFDALESGLSQGKYQIRYDSQNDASRKKRLEAKLRPLQEKRKQEQDQHDEDGMRQLFRDYLENMEARLYKSYYAFCDLQKELSHLPAFQKQVLDELYAGQVRELLSKPAEELEETISNSVWQTNKQKLIAGKSIMLFILAERAAEGALQARITEGLEAMEEAVIRNTYAGYLEEGDLDLPADVLLEKGKQAWVEGSPEKAIAYYWPAANQNQAEAMARLGLSFIYGLGVPTHNEKAHLWLERAAKHRSPEGLCGLGVCYQWGYDVEQDVHHAMELFQEAFSLGCPSGAFGIGTCYEFMKKQPEDAFSWYQKAAENGSLMGMYNAYSCCCNGNGTPKDTDAADEYFAKLVEAASPAHSALDTTSYDAFNFLGRAFHNGWMGTGGSDREKSMEWFRRGAAVGNRASKTWFIDFNEYEGRNRILNELADEDYGWAFNQLAGFYASGTGLPEDKVQSNFYHLKAAKYGESDSLYNIGMAFLTGGPGIRQDAAEAVFWLEKAAAQGVEAAGQALETCREQAAAEQREARKAELEARRSSILEEKEPLDSQAAALLEQIKEAEVRIDSAASEKEEAAAVAEKERLQAELHGLKARIQELDDAIAALEDEEGAG